MLTSAILSLLLSPSSEFIILVIVVFNSRVFIWLSISNRMMEKPVDQSL